jgi:hypothetical protein
VWHVHDLIATQYDSCPVLLQQKSTDSQRDSYSVLLLKNIRNIQCDSYTLLQVHNLTATHCDVYAVLLLQNSTQNFIDTQCDSHTVLFVQNITVIRSDNYTFYIYTYWQLRSMTITQIYCIKIIPLHSVTASPTQCESHIFWLLQMLVLHILTAAQNINYYCTVCQLVLHNMKAIECDCYKILVLHILTATQCESYTVWRLHRITASQ